MRMVVISLIFLLIMIGIWAWFHFAYIEPTTDYYFEEFNYLSETIKKGDWDKAKSDIELYNKKWEEMRGIWIYFLNQDDIDNVDISMKKLDIYIKNYDKTMAQAELEHLRILFNIIKDNECLTLDNIF
ncbi:DUF4363 family protein [Sedimentibacter sp. MB31-C6]|uniref:DUF4363 family protein n=1 Tax=Sedimentibacter sp. MB31-C6 TaxID=3109366 RepID=UPI002DDCD0EB|nr:DUF4363 family protein [Sedimentibacter sp. MB36-C1]WSI04697.1 DUF4363 family protein [Sedimentibacter sp. MB36-C1]